MADTGTVLEAAEVTKPAAIVVFERPGEILGPNTEYDRQRVALLRKHAATVAAAGAIKEIATADDATWATEVGRALQSNIKEAQDFFKPIKAEIDKLKRPVLEAEKKDTDSLEAEKGRIGALLTTYERAEREKRERAERAAREAEEKAARENQLERAIELEASGELEQAEAVLEDTPVPVAIVAPRQSPTHVAGQIGRTTYSAQVVNLMELVKAVAAGVAPIQALKADESFLNKQAASFREGFRMPGCKLVTQAKTHFRS